MVENIFTVMAVIGTIITIVELCVILKMKKNVPIGHCVVFIVSQALVLPLASVNLYKEASFEHIVAFIFMLAIIIGSAIALAIYKSDD